MKIMTQEEGNELIAEFDADTITNLCKRGVSYKMYRYERYPFHTFTVQDLQYHTSWGWLMPVVEKISAVWWTDFDIDKMDEETIQHEKSKVVDLAINSPIKVVWNKAIEFINWFNQQDAKDE